MDVDQVFARTPERESKRVAGTQLSDVKSAGPRYALLEWKFPTWEPDHLHWVSPSNFIIHSDGTWFFYAQHLANMRRNNQLGIDLGWDWSFEFEAAYTDSKDTVIHASTYHFAHLNYKVERDNYTATGRDERFSKILANLASASGRRVIR